MAEGRFEKLVEEQQGFEFTVGYRDEEDHIMGGKNGTYWYIITRDGKPVKTFIASCRDGVWTDQQITGRGKKKKAKEVASGSTIRRIEKEAFLGQDEKWVKDRKPRVIQDSHPHFHYVYGFGDKALDVSEQYGVTIGYSDLADVPAGFHLRMLYTGGQVDLPG